MESSEEDDDYPTNEWITSQSCINSIDQSNTEKVTHTEKGIKTISSGLLDLKDAVENLSGSVQSKYVAFLSTLKHKETVGTGMGVGCSVPKPVPVPEASKEGGEKPAAVPEGSKEEEKKPTAVSVPAAPKTHAEPKGPNSREEPPKSVDMPKEPAAKPKNVPHMYEAIIKGADNPSDSSLLDKIRSSGVFLNNKKQKYWVEGKTGCNCFMLFARGLLITWSENEQFWQWLTLKENSDPEIEIASLRYVCWLEIHGRFETSYLTPGVMYEVVFVVMMTKLGHEWAKPVNLRVKLPDGTVARHEVCLLEMPKGQWTELKVGEFMVGIGSAGEMEFSLYEYEGGQWKQGLVIRGAIIRPTK